MNSRFTLSSEHEFQNCKNYSAAVVYFREPQHPILTKEGRRGATTLGESQRVGFGPAEPIPRVVRWRPGSGKNKKLWICLRRRQPITESARLRTNSCGDLFGSERRESETSSAVDV